MSTTLSLCPLCEGTFSRRNSITLGRPIRYPVASWYHCDGCGYQEAATPLTRTDVKKLIVDLFRGRQITEDSE